MSFAIGAGRAAAAARRVRKRAARPCEPDVVAAPLRARDTAGEVEAARGRAGQLLEEWSAAEEAAAQLEARLAALEADQ